MKKEGILDDGSAYEAGQGRWRINATSRKKLIAQFAPNMLPNLTQDEKVGSKIPITY